MNKSIKIIIALVVVGVVAAAALLMTKDSSKDNTDDTTSSSISAAASVTITYSDGSFSPSEVTVQAGGTVKIVNESDDAIAPASDDHPVHTDNPEINFGEIPAGESKTVTVDAKGTWGYHNHLSASETGTVIVE